MREIDQCQNAFVEKTLRERTLDTYAQSFFDIYDEKARTLFLDWVDSDPSQRFCDFGCGRGIALRELQSERNNLEIWGLDMYPSVFAPNYIKAGNFNAMPFGDNYFGRGVSVMALGCYAENMKELTRHFQEVFRVLSPGGRLLLAPFQTLQQENAFAVQRPSSGSVGYEITMRNSFLCNLPELAGECGFTVDHTQVRIVHTPVYSKKIIGIEFVK